MKVCQILLFMFFIFISIKTTVQSPIKEIKIIPDAFLNATAAFASFEEYKDSDYLYFSYDFNYHNLVNPKELDQAYFKITSDQLFFNRELKYIFVDKKQDEVNPKDLDIKSNIIWLPCFVLNVLQIDNEYNYYIRILRTRAEKNKKNTIIFQIPIKNKGQIEIENLYSFPEEIRGKKNQNFNSWPQMNYKDMPKDEYRMNDPIKQKPIKKNYHYNYYYQGNHYKYHHNSHCFYFSVVLGVIFSQIWMIIFVLYFIVNRRKKNHLAVIIRNAQNN